MRILLTGNTTFKLANFRKGLIRRLISDGHDVIILAPPDEYVKAVKEDGCLFIPIKINRSGIKLLEEFALLKNIISIFFKIRPDIVLSFTIKNNIYSGFACQLLKIPFIPNVTGLGPVFDQPGLLSSVARILYRVAFPKALVVFLQNHEDLSAMLSWQLVTKEKAELLPGSGVDLKYYAYASQPSDDKSICFLFVARLLWSKGIGVYVDAARIVKNRFPNAQFRILGPFDPDSQMGVARDQIESWVDEGAIKYCGSAMDVRPFLEAADCIVLPSFYREGTPRSLLEAAAVGRPIITTDMPGCRDVVVNGQTGYVVPPRDAEGLAGACIRFISLTSDQRRIMGRASRLHIENSYDEQFVIESYCKYISKINQPA